MTADKARKAIQKILGVEEDGRLGKISQTAWEQLRNTPADSAWPAEPITLPSGKVDARSEANIATLNGKLQPLARQLVLNAAEKGIHIVVTSGTRTYAEQNELFAQGRTKGGNIVTNARGGFSNHNFGCALDITIFDGKKPVWESPQYKTVGQIGKELGLEWGGDWQKPDEPHFQLRPQWAGGMGESAMLTELRRRHASDTDPYA